MLNREISQSVSQVASATMVGIDPMIAVYMYAIYALTGLGGTALFVWATKSMFPKILLFVIIGLLIWIIYQLPGNINPLDSEIHLPVSLITDDIITMKK